MQTPMTSYQIRFNVFEGLFCIVFMYQAYAAL